MATILSLLPVSTLQAHRKAAVLNLFSWFEISAFTRVELAGIKMTKLPARIIRSFVSQLQWVWRNCWVRRRVDPKFLHGSPIAANTIGIVMEKSAKSRRGYCRIICTLPIYRARNPFRSQVLDSALDGHL
jgi:hypothetical protein